MKFGFVRTGVFTPKIKVADVKHNVQRITEGIKEADEKGVELLVFPELCITGYTCGDLFYSDVLLNAAKLALREVCVATLGKKMIVFVGLPVKKNGLIYNSCAAVCNGRVLSVIPKRYIPNYNEFYEKRYFNTQGEEDSFIDLGFTFPLQETENGYYEDGLQERAIAHFGSKVIFCEEEQENFRVSAEICEDLWSAFSPSQTHAVHGATLIVNCSCSDETIGKAEYRRNLVSMQSAKLNCAYIYADAGEGESTTDMVFAGHNIIAENGKVLAESQLFSDGLTVADVDVDFLSYERSKTFNYNFPDKDNYLHLPFRAFREQNPDPVVEKLPFVPAESKTLDSRAELILKMQAEGLKKRLVHTGAKTAVLGLSGGLDSTLAILVAVRAMQLAGKSTKDVIAVTMPCFGTTSRTFDNTVKLAGALGTTLKKVDITKSVTRHLKDIKHDGSTDVTYENAQARERTQVIMDIANMTGGLVVGTGDLSELALGWATYNGDHMSMYGVNSSVPKTLVRHIVGYCASKSKGKLKAVLTDILATPVSPELLPPKDGEISQRTEDIVGPYELHDFFLYNTVRKGYSPLKIYYLAKLAFKGEFDLITIKKWLKIFVKRFFAQQFKRSCVPDGVKVGSVTLSPRGDWRMPSDASSALWLEEAENI